MMTGWLLAQAGLFMLAVWSDTRGWRAIPVFRALPGRFRRWWIPIAAIGVLAPLGIVYLGRGSFADADSCVSALTTTLLCAGLSAVIVGFRADPSRGRRRCSSCWYDMSGLRMARCPECGRTIRSERELLHTRRSHRLVLLGGVLVALSYLSLKIRAIGDSGPRVLVPTTPMILGLPWVPESLLNSHEGGLRSRLGKDQTWPWQERLLTVRARHVFRRDTDPSVLIKIECLLAEDDVTLPLSEGAVVVLAESIARGATDPREALVLLGHFPETLSSPAQSRMLDPLRRILKEGSKQQVDVASYLCLLMSDSADEIAESLNGWAPRNATAMWSLARLAGRSDHAWALFKSRLVDNAPEVRKLAVTFADMAPENLAQSFVDGALDDPDVSVATAAARNLVRIGHPMTCDQVDRLADVARRRPELRLEIVELIGSASCVTESLLDLYRVMLRSPNAAERGRAITSICRHKLPLAVLAGELDAVNTNGLDSRTVEDLKDAARAVHQNR